MVMLTDLPAIIWRPYANFLALIARCAYYLYECRCPCLFGVLRPCWPRVTSAVAVDRQKV